ncbi:hypothetical protein NJBCHELONAE_02630 [Mycobacteroides chelonae]|nr:hypothetical protein NJBCHELONAE_02630 [Mycobacteroides chelonae]
MPFVGGDVAEAEMQHGAALGDRAADDVTAHIPEQQLGVQILVPDLTDPPDPPLAQHLDDGAQLTAGVRGYVAVVVAFGDPGAHQPVQPLGQQRRGHAGHSAPNIVEMLTAEQ